VLPACASAQIAVGRSRGVVFTTIHKFFPEEKGDRHPILSERRNIVVIADEAQRSQLVSDDRVNGSLAGLRLPDVKPARGKVGIVPPQATNSPNRRPDVSSFSETWRVARNDQRRRCDVVVAA
jgi:hypothetical protein